MQYINALIELVPVYVPLAVMFAGLLLFFPLRAWFYGIIKRIRKSEAGERSPATVEPVTVVICCRDEGDYLERNLPAILGQKGVKFEVVVVDDCSTDSTPEVLKRYEKQYPNLKHTFVPKSARYVSHEKLAVTLGIKAAKYEWIVLTRADCVPAGDSWLYEMSCCFAPEKDIVLGYSNFHYDGSLLARRAVYERIFYQLVWYNSARRRAVGGDGCNMAFRRSVFMANNGYASMLDYIYGADDLLVNSLSCRNRTAVCCSAAAIVEQQERLSVHEIRKWKMRRVAAQRQMSRKERICFLPVKPHELGSVFTRGRRNNFGFGIPCVAALCFCRCSLRNLINGNACKYSDVQTGYNSIGSAALRAVVASLRHSASHILPVLEIEVPYTSQ